MRKGVIGAIGVCMVSAVLARADAPPAAALTPAQPATITAPEVCGVSPGCSCCDDCDCPQRLWFTADYLLWWVKDGPSPIPLVTTGSPNDPIPGAVGQPNTRVLFGGDAFDYRRFNGMRFGLGVWLDSDAKVGVEGGYFVLERRSVRFSFGSDETGNPLLGRPIIDGATLRENDYVNSFPGEAFGGGTISSSSRFQGWEANMAANLARSCSVRFDVLAGFRYLDLNEDLLFQDRLQPLNPGFLTFLGQPVPLGTAIADYDRFHTINHFYGGQIGGRMEWVGGRIGVGVVGKIAFGASDQLVRIDGTSSLLPPGQAPVVVPGGIYAQTTNIGDHSRTEFAIVPEIGLNLIVLLTDNIRARVGYTFIYWSNVVRPANQIDRTVNPFITPTDQLFGQGVGPARPGFVFNDSDFWAQGINVGLELRF